jgi:hypothetical protein
MRRSLVRGLSLALVLSAALSARAETLGTAFTYQGRLTTTADEPVSEACDFVFDLHATATSGSAIAPSVVLADVPVEHGVFTVQLDFGSAAFGDGEKRWLEIAVGCASQGGQLTVLAPRQELTAAPRALHGEFSRWGGLTGVPADIADGDDVDDADADASNELQALSLDGHTLRLSDSAATADLSGYLDDTDDQDLAAVLAEGADAAGSEITNLAAPSSDQSAATRKYVDDGLAAKQDTLGYDPVDRAGDSMSGVLAAPGFVTGSVTYGDGAIARNTGGALDLQLGGAPGDDLRVDGSTLVVKSDSDRIGIGTATPAGRLHIHRDLGDAVIDQQSTAASDGFFNLNMGQSFTAGVTGQLTTVGFLTAQGAGIGATLRVFAGHGIGGTLLSTQSITLGPNGTFSDYALPTPVDIVQGQAYTFFVTCGQNIILASSANQNPYPGGGMRIGVGGSAQTDYDLAFRTYASGPEAMLFVGAGSNGNVGIGTTAPERKLHVRDVIRLQARPNPPASAVIGDLYTDDSGALCFYTGSAWSVAGGTGACN